MRYRSPLRLGYVTVVLAAAGLGAAGCKTHRCPADLTERFHALAEGVSRAHAHAPRIQPRRAFECFDVPGTDASLPPLPKKSRVFSLTPEQLTSQIFWVGEQLFGVRRYGKTRAEWTNPNKDRRDRDCIHRELNPQLRSKGHEHNQVVIAVTGDTAIARVVDLLSAIHEAGTKVVWLAFGAKPVASLPAPADRAFHERIRREHSGKDPALVRQIATEELERLLQGCKATKQMWSALLEDNFETLYPNVIKKMLVPALRECRCPKSVDRIQTAILLLYEPLCHFVGRQVTLDPAGPSLKAKRQALWRDVAPAAATHDGSTFWITIE